jgi:hypothetical protein
MSQINRPSDYFNTATYTGTGSAQSITTGFQPDWTWTKIRNTTGNHREQDSVRGTGSELYPNLTNAEATGVTQAITSWTSTGYNIGTDTGINNSGSSYVSWNWLAGGTAVSNTDGSITSSVSANTTSGFSIVSYTGNETNSTVGHGLGVAPSMIIFKATWSGTSTSWICYNKNLPNGASDYIYLNNTNASGTYNNFQNTAPTSNVFYLSSHFEANPSGSMIAYCFAEKKGFSKFGKYTGNGSADGTFVYTGFKPAMVIVKNISSTADWQLYDNKRANPFNYVSARLMPNTSGAELSTTLCDFVSNGIKFRNADLDFNNSGQTYIYMAFAENPLVGTNNIPATAR